MSLEEGRISLEFEENMMCSKSRPHLIFLFFLKIKIKYSGKAGQINEKTML